MFCIHCGERLEDTDKFCTKCGTEVYLAEVEKKEIDIPMSIPESDIIKVSFVHVMHPECEKEEKFPVAVRVDNQLTYDLPMQARVTLEMVPGNHVFEITSKEQYLRIEETFANDTAFQIAIKNNNGEFELQLLGGMKLISEE